MLVRVTEGVIVLVAVKVGLPANGVYVLVGVLVGTGPAEPAKAAFRRMCLDW